MVQGVEQQGVELAVPVTLNVGGYLVSGYVISGKEYFEEFAELVARGLPDAFDEERKQTIAKSFNNLRNIYDTTEDRVEDVIAQGGYNFVHLRDALFLHPSGDTIPSTSGMLWRTKLEAVDGFTLGMLRPELRDEDELEDEPELDE
jgi:hypothetical protein